MKTIITTAMVIGAASLLMSCGSRLSGTWNVERYESTKAGEQGVMLTNIGTVHFNGSGTGQKHIKYTALGVTNEDNHAFEWKGVDGKYITITGAGSDFFSKTWIVMENKSNFQKWKSTDGANGVQIIELKK